MKNYIFITILLAIFFGLGAGFAGQIIGRYYISHDLAGFALTREFDFLDGRSNLIIRDPRKVVVSQDAKVEETRAAIEQSFYKLYSLNLLEDDYLSLDNPLSLAMTISSDGWLLSILPDELLGFSQDFLLDNIRLVGPDRSIFTIEELLVFEADALKLLFLKADNLNNAVLRRSVDSQEMIAGQSLLIFKGEDSFSLASLVDHGLTDIVLSSDSFNRHLSILSSDDFLDNSFVYNLAGDFMGLSDAEGNFYSAPLLAAYWRSFLVKEEPAFPYLGVHYLDLSKLKFLENNLSRGALIYGDSLRPAVLSASPAAEAGLRAGDIISHINGQELNNDLDLSSVILSLNPGEQIIINYYRAGEENEISLILGEK